MSNIVPEIEQTKNEKLTTLFEEYKQSEEYTNYFNLIQEDKPNLSVYLINIILYGYFYESYIASLPITEQQQYKSLLTQEQKLLPVVKGDMKGINVYQDEDEYKTKFPDLKPIKTIGEPLKFEESVATLLEKGEPQNEII